MSIIKHILLLLLQASATWSSSFQPLLSSVRPLNNPPFATVTVHHDLTDVVETTQLTLRGNIESMNLLLRNIVNNNLTESGIVICLKSSGWCSGLPKECSKQYRLAEPHCWSLRHHDASEGFSLHIQGNIYVQVYLEDQNGFLLGFSDYQKFDSLQDTELKALTKEAYFLKFQQKEMHSPFGANYYGIFSELLRQIFVNKDGVLPMGELVPYNAKENVLPLNVVEVGVARAGHASNILKELSSTTLLRTMYGVDPYLANYDDRDLFAAKKQLEFDAMSEWIQQRLQQEEEARGLGTSRFQLLRTTSDKAVALLADVTIHAVFVDGDHRAVEVLKDLNAWYPKIIPGGLIAGDDFHLPGVAEGVAMFVAQFDEISRPVVQAVSNTEGYDLFAFTKPVQEFKDRLQINK